MRARSLLLLAVALVLAGCDTYRDYHVERSRTYAQDKQVVWERLLAFLERNQIAVTEADPASGRIVAQRLNYDDQGWAYCERRRVYEGTGSGSTRMSWALRVDRDLALQAAVAEAAGATRVTVDARFTEKQDDPNSFKFFTQPCRSKGVLEGALLDALGPPVASPPAQTPPDTEPSS
jgi:hypothetical protein